MRRPLVGTAVVPCVLFTFSCASDGPVAPSSSALEQFAQALRQQGLTVSVGGEVSPAVNGFFSVPAHPVRVNSTEVRAFEYPTAEAAAAEARLISEDGQPSPTARVTWVSTPRFYRKDSLIVLYVGCSADIIQALQATLGTPIVIGRTPCTVG